MRTVLVALIFTLALLPRLALAAPTQPITMTAFLDKSVYQIGQPIVLEVDLHNTRSHKVTVTGGAYEQYSFKFVLLDSAGKSVPRTARGKEMVKPPPPVYVNPVIVFGPRATRRYRINLAALFLVSRGKSYTLRVSRTMDLLLTPEALPSASPLTAGPFKFRIMEAAASPNAPARPFVDDPNVSLNLP